VGGMAFAFVAQMNLTDKAEAKAEQYRYWLNTATQTMREEYEILDATSKDSLASQLQNKNLDYQNLLKSYFDLEQELTEALELLGKFRCTHCGNTDRDVVCCYMCQV
jgi:hypothetical protein